MRPRFARDGRDGEGCFRVALHLRLTAACRGVAVVAYLFLPHQRSVLWNTRRCPSTLLLPNASPIACGWAADLVASSSPAGCPCPCPRYNLLPAIALFLPHSRPCSRASAGKQCGEAARRALLWQICHGERNRLLDQIMHRLARPRCSNRSHCSAWAFSPSRGMKQPYEQGSRDLCMSQNVHTSSVYAILAVATQHPLLPVVLSVCREIIRCLLRSLGAPSSLIDTTCVWRSAEIGS